MIKSAALAALAFLAFQAPKRLEQRRYDTTPLPGISEALAKVTPKKPRVVRKKHICTYSHSDLWGAFAFGLLLGGFLMYLIL